ncbi:MAG: peptide-N-glycosidase F-related protein [Candidatus Eisenbacteria bacterium]
MTSSRSVPRLRAAPSACLQALALASLVGTLYAAPALGAAPLVVEIFSSESIHFHPAVPDTFASPGVTAEENGRVVVTTVAVEPSEWPHRIVARVSTGPIPKDDVSVADPWDRAGNVQLRVPGGPPLELVKFVTAYGGVTEREVDVTHLAPALEGECEFAGFVDTWLSPAWKLSLSLEFRPADEWELLETNASPAASDWVLPVLYEQDATATDLGPSGYDVEVLIPEGTERVVLHYLTSGHCTDGRDEDEFKSKDNVMSVDGVVVERMRPWRDDCGSFRAVNPYTRRWSNGWWSSDYARSGWCPGDAVPPVRVDLTDHLTPGVHVMTFNVEGVRPRDENDHYGYWRLSAYLVGWMSD